MKQHGPKRWNTEWIRAAGHHQPRPHSPFRSDREPWNLGFSSVKPWRSLVPPHCHDEAPLWLVFYTLVSPYQPQAQRTLLAVADLMSRLESLTKRPAKLFCVHSKAQSPLSEGVSTIHRPYMHSGCHLGSSSTCKILRLSIVIKSRFCGLLKLEAGCPLFFGWKQNGVHNQQKPPRV